MIKFGRLLNEHLFRLCYHLISAWIYHQKGHNAAIHCVTVMMDSRRIISSDQDGSLCVWLAESGTLLQTIQGPYKSLAATNNMKFAVRSSQSICTLIHVHILKSEKKVFHGENDTIVHIDHHLKIIHFLKADKRR